MKKRACLLALTVLTLTVLTLILSGCWSKMELTERAFVLAIAVDKGKEETFEVTAQIYRPASQFGAPSDQATKSSFVNVTLGGASVSNIIRNNKSVTGRHSQFSHIQIILISEEIARERLSSILDFFYRDPEFRLGTSIMIAKGKARDYLSGQPMIENTLGSQVFKQLNFSSSHAGRAINTTILDLAFQLKSESASAMMPVIKNDREFKQRLVQGIALVTPDRMVGRISPEKSAYLMLLANKYKYGILEVPCDRNNAAGQMETFEVLHASTRVTPVLKGDSVSARIDMKLDASIEELVCTKIRDMADEARYTERAERFVKEQLEDVLRMLQKQKVDVLGIGHKIYLRHPSRWKKLKPEWTELYARMPIEVNVQVDIMNSKMMNPGPFSRIGED